MENTKKVIFLIFVSIFLFSIFPAPAFSNGGPVLAIASGIAPNTETTVELLSENVSIRLTKKVAYIDAVFVLKNTGPKCEITVGFPAETLSWSNFECYVDDQPISTKDGYDTTGQYFFWKHWGMAFEKDETRILRVVYEVYLERQFLFNPAEHYRIFTYTLVTGALWKGKIGEAKLTISLDGVNPANILSYGPTELQLNSEAKTFVYHRENFEPDKNIRLVLADKRYRYAETLKVPLKEKFSYNSGASWLIYPHDVITTPEGMYFIARKEFSDEVVFPGTNFSQPDSLPLVSSLNHLIALDFEGKEKWRVELLKEFYPQSFIVSKSHVFIWGTITEKDVFKHVVYGLSKETGKKLWEKKFSSLESTEKCCIEKNSLLVFTLKGTPTTSRSIIYLNPENGREIKSVSLPSNTGSGFFFENGHFFHVGNERIQKISDSGEILWSYKPFSHFEGFQVLVRDENVCVLGIDPGLQTSYIYCLDLNTGKEKFVLKSDFESVGQFCDMEIADDILYLLAPKANPFAIVQEQDLRKKVILAVNLSDGKIIKRGIYESASMEGYCWGTISVAKEKIYLNTNDGFLVAFDRETLEPIWDFQSRNYLEFLHYIPIIKDNDVLFLAISQGLSESKVYGFEETGHRYFFPKKAKAVYYKVIVGSFGNRIEARKYAEDVTQKVGIYITVEPSEKHEDMWLSVVAGKYDDLEYAEEIVFKLKRKGFDAFISKTLNDRETLKNLSKGRYILINGSFDSFYAANLEVDRIFQSGLLAWVESGLSKNYPYTVVFGRVDTLEEAEAFKKELDQYYITTDFIDAEKENLPWEPIEQKRTPEVLDEKESSTKRGETSLSLIKRKYRNLILAALFFYVILGSLVVIYLKLSKKKEAKSEK